MQRSFYCGLFYDAFSILTLQGDSNLLSGFSWRIIFKTKKKEIKLFKEYESVTQKVLLFIEPILQNANQHHEGISLQIRCPSSIQFPSKYGPRKHRQ
jgi:hypothetical protein